MIFDDGVNINTLKGISRVSLVHIGPLVLVQGNTDHTVACIG
jgi:hypothetical protein